MSRRSLLASVLAFLALRATTVGAGDSGLEIEGAWVRALPPTQSNTAAYLSVRNRSAAIQRIVAASAPPAGRVEFHRSAEVDGMMRMQRLTELEVPAGGTLELAPGGIHLMLLDLERMPAAGETLTVCLQTGVGAATCTEAPVRKAAAQDQEDSHQHHH